MNRPESSIIMKTIKRVVRVAMRQRVAELLPGVTKSRIRAWAHPPVYPTILQMEPTRRCNLRCVMCALTQFYHNDKTQDMTLEDFKRIVSQLPKTTHTVTIQGTGEPLLNRDIIAMIEYARECGFRTHFNSNLLLLTDEMAERLVAAGHGEVMISIETTNPERYADIRRNGTIERFLENLDRLNQAKQRAGSAAPKITACCILMKHTLPDIPELVATLKKHGVIGMHVADMCTYPECSEPLTLADGSDLRDQSLSATMSEEEVWREVAKIKALSDEQFYITVPGEWGGLKREAPRDGVILTCAELWTVPFVKTSSEMATCCWAPQFVMGDFKKQTFEEIWFGQRYRDMRERHLTDNAPEHCRHCQQRIYAVAVPSSVHGRIVPPNTTNDIFL